MQGRDGKGSIFVFGAGNGGQSEDSCAADGYVQSIYTIAIGALNSDGRPTSYDERCSAKMASAFVNDINTPNVSVEHCYFIGSDHITWSVARAISTVSSCALFYPCKCRDFTMI